MSPPDALAQFVRAIPLFEWVEDRYLSEVLRLLRPIELPVGEVLFREGERGTSFWVLEGSAEVEITRADAGRRTRLQVARLGAGEVVGEMALMDEAPRSGSARVTRAGRAYQIQASDFASLWAQGSPAAFQILRRLCVDLCQRLRTTTSRGAPPLPVAATARGLVGRGAPLPEELASLPALAQWPRVVQLALSQKLTWDEAGGAVPIFSEGDAPDAIWLVVEGEVVISRHGRTLSRLGPGQLFGVVSLIDGGSRCADCATTGKARLLRLSGPDFEALFRAGHRFAYRLVEGVTRQLVAHLREANRLFADGGEVLPSLELDRALAGTLSLGLSATGDGLADWSPRA